MKATNMNERFNEQPNIPQSVATIVVRIEVLKHRHRAKFNSEPTHVYLPDELIQALKIYNCLALYGSIQHVPNENFELHDDDTLCDLHIIKSSQPHMIGVTNLNVCDEFQFERL